MSLLLLALASGGLHDQVDVLQEHSEGPGLDELFERWVSAKGDARGELAKAVVEVAALTDDADRLGLLLNHHPDGELLELELLPVIRAMEAE